MRFWVPSARPFGQKDTRMVTTISNLADISVVDSSAEVACCQRILFEMEAATEWLGVCVEQTSEIAVGLVQRLTQQSSVTEITPPAKPARHVSHEKPPVIAATTSFAMVAGITFGAGGAMFASSALLGTICAAGLYCRSPLVPVGCESESYY